MPIHQFYLDFVTLAEVSISSTYQHTLTETNPDEVLPNCWNAENLQIL